MAPYKQKVHADPRLTFSALAKLMGPHAAHVHVDVVRESKYPNLAQVLSYKNAMRHLSALAAGTTPSGVLEPHEIEVVSRVKAKPLKLPAGVTAALPLASQKKWHLAGVEISVFPDVLLSGPKGTGALKFYCSKAELGKGVAKTMAALLHHHAANVVGAKNVAPEYCAVYDVRRSKWHVPGKVASNLIARATGACLMTAALWPKL